MSLIAGQSEMPSTRSRWFASVLAAALLGLVTPVGAADVYPSRTVRLVVPNTPGGPVDSTARLIAEELQKLWKQPAIVENRPGAGGNLGADSVAKAPPDGYTLLLSAPGPLVINPSLLTNTPFDPQKDFEPITIVYSTPIVLTTAPSFPGKSVAELVKYIQQQPGKHNFASGGIGTTPHLLAEVFKQRAVLDVQHIPYRGGGDMTMAVVRGDATFSFNGLLVMPLVEKGEMKVLAVAAPQRTMLAPSITTMEEGGFPGIEGEGWGGLLAPRNTPESIQSKLCDDVRKVLADPAVRNKINQIGVEPVGSTAAELRARISKELIYWAEAIKVAQLRPQ